MRTLKSINTLRCINAVWWAFVASWITPTLCGYQQELSFVVATMVAVAGVNLLLAAGYPHRGTLTQTVASVLAGSTGIPIANMIERSISIDAAFSIFLATLVVAWFFYLPSACLLAIFDFYLLRAKNDG